MVRVFVAVVFVLFTAFSFWIVGQEGYLAFLEVPKGSLWGLQITLDLVIAIALFVTWMIPDARRHGIPALPYVLACATIGSIGALAYLIHRGARGARAG